MDRLLLIASTFCFLLAVVRTALLLRTHTFRPGRSNFLAIVAGFVLQTAFLAVRGNALGRCPLTNLFEVFIFMGWSVALIYLVVGPTYRLVADGGFHGAAGFAHPELCFAGADRSAAAAEDGGESVAGVPRFDVDRGLWGVRVGLHRGADVSAARAAIEDASVAFGLPSFAAVDRSVCGDRAAACGSGLDSIRRGW